MAIWDGWWRRDLERWRQRGSGRRPARDRRRIPEVAGLERRELLTIVRPEIALTAVPSLLPPSGATVTVTVFGQIASTRADVHDGFFRVTDEYRRVEPHGDVALTPLGSIGGYYRYGFAFDVPLQAQARSTTSSGGRQYFVLVGATDQDNTEGQTTTVFVATTRPPVRFPFGGPRFRFPRGGRA
ncbi:MAG: hypothetical protein AB7I30_11290 [Isosphaeraceae bacterium]